MTNLRDDLPPDVRRLCRAMLSYHGTWLVGERQLGWASYTEDLHAAFQPFLAKPEPKPVIPEWGDLTPEQRADVVVAMVASTKAEYIYNAIRKATAKVE